MIATQQKIYTFTEYLNYQDSTDNKYELFNGELISMPPASGFHALILAFLYDYLIAEIKRLNLTWKVMPATVGIRTDKAKSRILILCSTSNFRKSSDNSCTVSSNHSDGQSRM